MSDRDVQGTNDDAQISKLSCVNLGYFEDNFLKYFVKKPSRRSPLINRGYFSRVYILRHLIQEFTSIFKNDKKHQILSLGAGFDSTWFFLKEKNIHPTHYFELDFLEITIHKISNIQKNEDLNKMIDSTKVKVKEKDKLISDELSILPVDLRDLENVEKILETAKFDYKIPTLILSECVLVYLEPDDSSALIRFFNNKLKQSIFVVYEQIKPDDAFGQQMLKNLEARGCSLKGLYATPTLEAHKKRFINNGWKKAMAWDMDTLYKEFVSEEEHKRISKIEIFDEFEEWHLIQGHYCIVIGINDNNGVFKKYGFKGLNY